MDDVSSDAVQRSPRMEKDRLLLRNQRTCSTIPNMDDDVEMPLAPFSVDPSPSVTSADLTLQEKLSLLSGDSMWTTARIPRLSIPSLTLSDGPHGIRKQLRDHSILDSFPATCFPTAAALACSWDDCLLQTVGVALQKESVHYGVHVLLGPGMNLKRHPAGGRNFEYFSEDPYLTGRLATAFVQGVQCSGTVAACVKHLAVNNQESHRFVVNAVVDERTLRELYYRGFETVVRQSRPATIMCAYNRLNGIFCSEHIELLTNILRHEWGFDGVTMTDWGAANQRSVGVKAGMDLEMPGSYGAHDWEIRAAVESGDLSMTDVDAAVDRLLSLIQKYGGDAAGTGSDAASTLSASAHDNKNYEYDERNPMWNEHNLLAHQVAMECCVLLKNDDDLLPLSPSTLTKIALIGDFGRDHARFQGMGSSQVHTIKVKSCYDELRRHVQKENIVFARGYDADDDHLEQVDVLLVGQAVEAARQADVVLLCIGLPEIMESEGFDRTHLRLPAQHTALVEAVCRANPNVVVILSNGGVVELPWFHLPKAILEGYLLGEAGGAAVVDLIFGVQSPCGKLAETIPERVEDILADQYFPGNRDRVEYREGLLVGYRYFDTAKKQVRYPFGHGLSYTTFAYSDLELTVTSDAETTVVVTFWLQNTGTKMAAKEVAQCYVHFVQSSVFRPDQELKDFAKINLEPGEKQQIRFTLSREAFAFYDVGVKDWVVERGPFEIRIGSSSRDICLYGTIAFPTVADKTSSDMARLSYPTVDEYPRSLDQVSDEEFFNRFGDNLNAVPRSRSLETDDSPVERTRDSAAFDRNSLLKEVSKTTLLGYILMAIVYHSATKDVKDGPAQRRQRRMVMETVQNLPLRALVLFSQGALSFSTLDACIALMNWHFLAALKSFGTSIYNLFRRKK